MGPSEFLTALWGREPAGFVQVWELRSKSTWSLTHGQVDELAGRPDYFTGVALSGRRIGTRQRMKSEQAAAIAGLWLDLDVQGGPDGKPGGLPSIEAAMAVAARFAAPSILVASGYGLHAWHLFAGGPWVFRRQADQTEAGRLAAAWQQLHREETARHGATLDATHDLARLLRLPGTVNAKDPAAPRPVRVLEERPVRHARDDLARLVGGVRVLPAGGRADGVDVRALPLTPELRERVELMLEQVPEFAAAWRREHRDLVPWCGWSASEWDMSVCSIAAQAEGFTDQDLASIVRANRLRWQPGDPKADRAGYLQLTVARARGRRDPVTARSAA